MELWKKDNSSEFMKVLFSKKFRNQNGERHIPIKEEILQQWEREIEQHHKNTSYGENLKRDIKIARKCNIRGDELLIAA